MTEELTNKLLEWVNNIESFAKDQIPDLAEQLIKWQVQKSTILIILFSSLSICFTYFGIKLYKKAKEQKKENQSKKFLDSGLLDGEEFFYASIIAYIFAFVFMGFFTYELLVLLKALVSPKIYLLEYFYHR